ncbi:MAG TPA: nuclear transport factor 2 family protein [Candidatus Krumholzibacteria bacterium]|jgi:hypothetical protein|nr:nuclear transport factor 2 family protein [Candidatus Krumholzibacteria bacterium]
MNRHALLSIATALAACAAFSACGGSSGLSGSQLALEAAPAQTALPALCQQLMNALPGDSLLWSHYFSDRGVYVDEGGLVLNKRELIHGMGAFPPGLSGSITVNNPRVTDYGDMAVIVFDADETESIYDQHLRVKYLSTYTWHKEEGKWRIVAAHTLVKAQDPLPMPISSARLEAYSGTYELSGKRRYIVDFHGTRLVGGPTDTDLKPLIPIGENVFVRGGDNLAQLIIFPVEPNGNVNRMIVRRKFADLVWKKVPRH